LLCPALGWAGSFRLQFLFGQGKLQRRLSCNQLCNHSATPQSAEVLLQTDHCHHINLDTVDFGIVETLRHCQIRFSEITANRDFRP
jgi:hypothetical protein